MKEKVYYFVYVSPEMNKNENYIEKHLNFEHEWNDYEKEKFFKQNLWRKWVRKLLKMYNRILTKINGGK